MPATVTIPSAAVPVIIVVIAVAGGLIGDSMRRRLADGGYRLDDELDRPVPRHGWLIPAVTALVWALLTWRLATQDLWALLPANLFLAAIGVVLFRIDADVHRLPDGIILPAYPMALALVIPVGLDLGWSRVLAALITGVVSFLVFFVLGVIAGDQFGFGDVKLAGLIGLVIGTISWEHAILAFLVTAVLGGLYAVGLLVARRAGLRTHLAYGPFLLLGALFAACYAPAAATTLG